MDRAILHCVCNGFFASVECIQQPKLWDVPMAVCGDPESRHGVILAKNELAKGYGVVTAETVWSARKKCPDLVLVEPHHELYHEYSRKINRIYGQYTDQVEAFSVDESWLDVTGSYKLFGSGKQIADELRARVQKELGLTMKKLGSAETVTDQLPAAGQILPGGSETLVYFGDTADERTVKMPDFIGMTRQQAADAAGKLGIYILVTGNNSLDKTVTATAQSILANTEVPVGTTVEIEFKDTGSRD